MSLTALAIIELVIVAWLFKNALMTRRKLRKGTDTQKLIIYRHFIIVLITSLAGKHSVYLKEINNIKLLFVCVFEFILPGLCDSWRSCKRMK